MPRVSQDSLDWRVPYTETRWKSLLEQDLVQTFSDSPQLSRFEAKALLQCQLSRRLEALATLRLSVSRNLASLHIACAGGPKLVVLYTRAKTISRQLPSPCCDESNGCVPQGRSAQRACKE